MFSLYISSLSISLRVSCLLLPIANVYVDHEGSPTSFLVSQFIQVDSTFWTVSIGISLIGVAIVVICKEMKKTRVAETSNQESELFQLERKLKLITG